MTTAILIVSALNLLWCFAIGITIFGMIENEAAELRHYTDEEHARLLTAIFNRDAIIEQLQNGEEVEV